MKSMVGNFFLIGLMGSGKTTIGRHLSFRLSRPFFDSDHEIIRRSGVSISTIFEIEGEEKFRDRESLVLESLVKQNDIILATGGGIVLREENRQLLQKYGTVIYLKTNVDTILERTRYDRSRPLLQTANPREKLELLLAQREPLYTSIADIIIDANELFLPNLMKNLVKKIEEHQSEKNENPVCHPAQP